MERTGSSSLTGQFSLPMPHNYSLWDNNDPAAHPQTTESLGEGAFLLRNFVTAESETIVDLLNEITTKAPFRKMITPGGAEMSVAMTNCGHAGWITDRRGYRYETNDPLTGQPWPKMPKLFLDVADKAATTGGFSGFLPDACLINRYIPGAKLSLHQDKDEQDFTQPIVSVSLGLPATFLFGGLRRNDKLRRMRIEHGDVVVWGGPSRMVFHGIEPLAVGHHPLLGEYRINLTFRKAL
jgi:DNA oxidative demethylase